MKQIRTWMAVGLLAAGAYPAAAFETVEGIVPIQLSLYAPLQIAAEEYSVGGLRLNLFYGRNKDLEGIDLGLVNHIDDHFAGIAVGVVNWVGDDAGGLRLGLLNHTGGEADILEAGLWNQAETLRGFQLGLVNRARTLRGLQIGLFNFSNDMEGMQIGLLNFGRGAGRFRVMPLFNLSAHPRD